MQIARASLAGGVAAGLAMSLAMVAGRRSGLLHKTLAEDAEDWLDRVAATRRRLGRGGTTALEQANHVAASAAFGVGYGLLRDRLPRVPALVLGPLYGAALYAVNIVGVAPRLGLTEGERKASPTVRAERLGLHLLYGWLAALATERLERGPRRRANEKAPDRSGALGFGTGGAVYEA